MRVPRRTAGLARAPQRSGVVVGRLRAHPLVLAPSGVLRYQRPAGGGEARSLGLMGHSFLQMVESTVYAPESPAHSFLGVMTRRGRP
ncbi:hypothetical protein NSPZN2_10763 [Nitrospira defluvii]|uniref:Uncharacterized protein n=1 Tax=Nitrospira defluvii TaxID=330214 RepID=A0ABM8QKJ6_9BACT|nr:hypothetical protein NSPZN2_10763 [Nitrospira defluvii]